MDSTFTVSTRIANLNNIRPSPDVRNQKSPAAWKILAVGVLAATAVLFLARLGSRGVVSEELRWAEVAREMRRTGDYVHPAINGRAYFDKPVGSYWLIVAASYLTGGVTEATARLPAAVTGWVGVWLVMRLAGRWYGPKAGVLAGVVLATAFGFAFYARRATADVETVTGVLAAVCLFEWHRHRPPGWWVVGLWAVMGVTSQMKGLLGFALPVAVFGAFGTWSGWANGGWRGVIAGNRWLFNRWTLLAAPLGGGLFLLPYALAATGRAGAAGDGLGLLFRENVQRFFRPHNHTGPVYLYLGVIVVLAAPWSAFLPAALVPRRPVRDVDRLAWAYFLAVFLFFTASASRRSYYLLPVLPAAAALIAAVLVSPAEALRPVARWLRTGGYVVLATFTLAAGLLALHPADVLPAPYDRLPPLPARWGFLAGWVVSVIAVSVGTFRPVARPWVAAGVAFAAVGYVLLVALPATDQFRTRRAFADAVWEQTGGGFDRLALFHARDVAFDLNSPDAVPEYPTADELVAAIRVGRTHWVVARRRYWKAANLPGRAIAEEAVNPWDGPDQLADKMMLIDVRPPGVSP